MKKVIAIILALVMVMGLCACGTESHVEAKQHQNILSTIRDVKGTFVVNNKFQKNAHRYVLEIQSTADVKTSNGSAYATDVGFEVDVDKYTFMNTNVGDFMTGHFYGNKTPKHRSDTMEIGGHTYEVARLVSMSSDKSEICDGEFLIMSHKTIDMNYGTQSEPDIHTELVLELQHESLMVRVEIPYWDIEDFDDFRQGDIIHGVYTQKQVHESNDAHFRVPSGKKFVVTNWWLLNN